MKSSPFNIPELRNRLSRFVSVNTALACVCVSKAFSEDFIYPIWWTVDFKTQPSFETLDHAIVVKNGRYIRIAKGIMSQNQLNLILRINVKDMNLSEIYIVAGFGFFHDLLRRNLNSFEKVCIKYCKVERSTSLVYLDILAYQPQLSKITYIDITWLSLTRSTLVSELRGCPALKDLRIWGTTIIDNHNTDDFQHLQVTFFQCMISNALTPPDNPLLVHFPNLETWSIYLNVNSTLEMIKDKIDQYCPLITSIETNCTATKHIIPLIDFVFPTITHLTLEYKYMTTDLIFVLTRRPRWESISVYDDGPTIYDEDLMYSLKDRLQDSSWMFQLIPRLCRKLNRFDMTYHKMNMDDVEDCQWACKDLKFLRVRVTGLDTKEKVDKAISLYREGRRWEFENGARNSATLDKSIEARVARHLLQFEKLETIWFGTKDWSVKEMDFTINIYS